MRKSIVCILCVLLVTVLPFSQVFAYEAPVQKDTIVSGQTYTGSLKLNDYGTAIPEEYTLNLAQNSLVRMFANTVSNNYFLEVDSPDNPYASPESYATIPGSDVTQIFESKDRPGPQRYGTSSLGITSYMDNPSSYSEVFTVLAAGTYKLRLRGGPAYSFKVAVEPLKYADDSPSMSNGDISTAININTDKDYDGNILFNGLIGGKFFNASHDYYFFEAKTAGKYSVKFTTDGFFQGTAGVTDASGNGINDSTAEIYLKLASDGSEAATFEKHVSSAKTVTKEFTIAKPGRYYLVVTPYGAIAGSYRFNINSPKNPGNNATTAQLKKLLPLKSTISLKVGASATNKITALYSDNSQNDVTTKVSLTSSSKCVSIYKNSTLKAISKGTARITAVYGGVKTSYTVVVK